MLAANRRYMWDRSLQWESLRGLSAEPDEIIDSVDVFLALGKLSVNDVAGFLTQLDPADRPLAAKVMESRGKVSSQIIQTAMAQVAQVGQKKKFPTKAVVIGAGVVGLLVVGTLVLR